MSRLREGLWLWRLPRLRRLWVGLVGLGLGLWLGRLLFVMGRVRVLLAGQLSDYVHTCRS